MKELKIFILEHCPYCKRALTYLEQYDLKDVKVTLIDERKESAIANDYDYYFVPSFFLDEVKIHEGAITEEGMRELVIRILQ